MGFKHSPAPWVVAEFLDGFNIKDEKHGRHIAFTPKQNNAHLIAAAPELLEQLIRLRNKIASYKPDDDDDLDIVDAVIAKALGQQ
ncbi:hypothetical protein [Proteus mirabilis]|uniref:hypothetical protein n=1 Tax=Proteus mirabilis TaxID=584 RepID=UPI001A2C8F59|nr:hypothetical protein [Proteus mirabilis]MDC5888643.1 hypothetical protein [Proteus mirabilis]MDC5906240.1 hypothetical protein [Proteus mirabilis]MDC5909781.1 hypothetical protein [Proteus mirabilis]MDC5923892.1 hypothetical protein [Proteus mirabilis]MDC5934421.1 hypothetical protein [Proteus mirabilis]